jgi:NADPH-dependent curcumin reductase CurA
MRFAAPDNQRVILAERPVGPLADHHFMIEDVATTPPHDGDVVCRTLWLSIDAAARTWMQGRTYRERLEVGDVIPGAAVAEVVVSRADHVPAGAIVRCDSGWQRYATLPGSAVRPVDDAVPITRHLSVLDVTGHTAYFGLFDVGALRPGETVVVSAAAGATGSLVGQLARIAGARIIGIVGSDDKGALLVERLGFDGFVNRHASDLRSALRTACPDGADVYFDNVGGPILATMLRAMNLRGRIVCCGAASQYDKETPDPGPAGVPGLLVTKRLRMEGFIVFDYAHRFDEANAALRRWLDDGSLVAVEDIVEGLASAPGALIGLLAGSNVGKRLVRVAD